MKGSILTKNSVFFLRDVCTKILIAVDWCTFSVMCLTVYQLEHGPTASDRALRAWVCRSSHDVSNADRQEIINHQWRMLSGSFSPMTGRSF
jgi:hypothetical protein